jgi:hypothetical protein
MLFNYKKICTTPNKTMSIQNDKMKQIDSDHANDHESTDALIPQMTGKRPGKKARRNAARRAKKLKALEVFLGQRLLAHKSVS